jgi:hypothetical protein
MSATVEVMENNLKTKLLKKFGVAFDGWSEFGVHYLAVFAVGPGVPNDGRVLLGFLPFEQEGDLSADQHAAYLKTLLTYYDRTIDDNIIYFCGDNCRVNIKFAKDLDMPLIGCNSHKLNLAVQHYLGLNQKDETAADGNYTVKQLDWRPLVKLLSTLMSKLKTIMGKAKLQEFTDCNALKANETRWNGNFLMCDRYLL